MIPQNYLEQWRTIAPWQTLEMVEQDLVISRVLVCLYNNSKITESLAFRGGTALNKLFIHPPARYSEDIDLVQINSEPIGETVKAIRSVLDEWLGSPKSKLTHRSAKLLYKFDSIGNLPSKLKIEINTTEHFHILPLRKTEHNVQSPWLNGKADITTYEIDELMATKLCALYQRNKGRDLFDLWLVYKQGIIDFSRTGSTFLEFCKRTNSKITRALFEQNLHQKFSRRDFREDIIPLLSPVIEWDFEEAYHMVLEKLVQHIPGEPWKGK
jgi:predicted nucleotidyltransferase component of viral defense system